jgi:hypothetical protein
MFRGLVLTLAITGVGINLPARAGGCSQTKESSRLLVFRAITDKR